MTLHTLVDVTYLWGRVWVTDKMLPDKMPLTFYRTTLSVYLSVRRTHVLYPNLKRYHQTSSSTR